VRHIEIEVRYIEIRVRYIEIEVRYIEIKVRYTEIEVDILKTPGIMGVTIEVSLNVPEGVTFQVIVKVSNSNNLLLGSM
jgi:hypothetical protein